MPSIRRPSIHAAIAEVLDGSRRRDGRRTTPARRVLRAGAQPGRRPGQSRHLCAAVPAGRLRGRARDRPHGSSPWSSTTCDPRSPISPLPTSRSAMALPAARPHRRAEAPHRLWPARPPSQRATRGVHARGERSRQLLLRRSSSTPTRSTLLDAALRATPDRRPLNCLPPHHDLPRLLPASISRAEAKRLGLPASPAIDDGTSVRAMHQALAKALA